MTAFLLALEEFGSNPRVAAARMIEQNPAAIALSGYLAGAAGVYIWICLGGPAMSPMTVLAGVIALAVFDATFGCFCAAVSHFFLDLTGGNGRAKSMFAAMGIGEFSKLLLIPLGLVLEALAPKSAGLSSLVYAGIIALQFWIAVEIVRPAYNTGALRAWSALLLPFVAIGLIVLALCAFLIAGLVLGIVGLLS